MDTNLTNLSLSNPVFNGSVKTLLLLFLLCPPGVPCTFIPFGLSGPAGDTVLHRDTKTRKTHSVHPGTLIDQNQNPGALKCLEKLLLTHVTPPVDPTAQKWPWTSTKAAGQMPGCFCLTWSTCWESLDDLLTFIWNLDFHLLVSGEELQQFSLDVFSFSSRLSTAALPPSSVLTG